MEPDNEEKDRTGGWGSSFKLLGAVGGLGIEMAAAVVAGAFLGQKGDEVLGTGSLLTVLGVLLGEAVADCVVEQLRSSSSHDIGTCCKFA